MKLSFHFDLDKFKANTVSKKIFNFFLYSIYNLQKHRK